MKVRRLGWLGTRTASFDATSRFFRDTLGLTISHEEHDFALFDLPGGTHDHVEVFGPEAEDTDLEAEFYTTGPVVGFVVDDIDLARAELAAAGIELIGDITWAGSVAGYGWFHFRAPDGCVYAMLQGTTALPEG